MRDIDTIPNRSELIERIERANRTAIPWILVQFILALGLGASVRWEQLSEQPLTALVAVMVILGPHVMGILRQYAVNKKEIGDLKEQTRYGQFDKYRLRQLVDNTLDRLDIPRPGPPVYITADKSLNAGALHLGLGGFFRALNGVYLNRQILYHLTPEEVQDIVGHELGHFYRYYLLTQRFHWLTLLLGAFSALLVCQHLGMSSYVSVFALSVSGSVFWMVSGWLFSRNIQSIEYLCDDFGAHVHGTTVSVNGLLKLGAESEMHLGIQQQCLSTRDQANLRAKDVIEAVEAATPYGHISREELERAVELAIKKRSKDRQKLSLVGFLEFAWKSDEDESEIDEIVEKIKKVQEVPRLNWEALLHVPGQISLNDRQVEQLTQMIEAYPDHVLFHCPEEIGESDGTHPPISSRILYLVKNKREIESGRA